MSVSLLPFIVWAHFLPFDSVAALETIVYMTDPRVVYTPPSPKVVCEDVSWADAAQVSLPWSSSGGNSTLLDLQEYS